MREGIHAGFRGMPDAEVPQGMNARVGRTDAWLIASHVLADVLAAAGSFMVSFLLRRSVPLFSPLQHGLDIYLQAWPALMLWPLMFWRERLYPGYWLTAGEELRRVVTGSTLAGLLAMAGTFVTKTGPQFSRPIIVGGWLISLALIPATRMLLKHLLKRMGFTGPRAVLLGAGSAGHIVMEGVARQRLPALRIEAIFDDDASLHGQPFMGAKVLGPLSEAAPWAQTHGISTAVVALPGMPRGKLVPLIGEQSKVFSSIIVIPDLLGLSSADVTPLQVQGVLALELRNNLLYRHNRIAKRSIDLVLLTVLSLITFPLAAAIAVAIWVESGRPILFRHKRLGRAGRPFVAWKFRTMVKDADAVLEKALESDPALRREWEASQKLKQDPRLTRVGRFLRRLSLDELPQLWNVLRGEMSLVGPRPIVEGEIERYGSSFGLYVQVLPGLTGLWQVSGRSDLSYKDRVWLDTHYVRNWSIWLDLVILARTVWIVLRGAGAY